MLPRRHSMITPAMAPIHQVKPITTRSESADVIIAEGPGRSATVPASLSHPGVIRLEHVAAQG